jgi:hypothetical protein
MTRRPAFEVIENARLLTRHDAACLADQIVDATIKTLQRDHKLPARTYFAWALALSELRAELTEKIAGAIVGRVDHDELITALLASLGGDPA